MADQNTYNSQQNNTPRYASTDGESLKSIVERLSKGVEDLTDAIIEQNKNNKIALEKEKSHLEKQEKTGNKLIGAFKQAGKDIWDWGVKQFTGAFNKVQNSYLANFNNITTKLNLTASGYTQLYQETAKQLRNTHLDIQFDTTDFTNALNTTLAQGLRGDLAQQKALYDLIGKKLIPSINTTNRDFVYAYRKWGGSFEQNSIGLQNLARMMGKNMEYYEQGMYNTTEEQFLRWYVNMGGKQEAYYNLQNTLGNWTDLFGQETVNEFVSALSSALQSGGATTQFAFAGSYATADELWKALSDPQALAELFQRYSSTMGNLYNSMGGSITALNILSGAGLSPSAQSVAAFARFGKGATSENITVQDLLASYEAGVAQLTDGLYASETEKFEKLINNTSIVVDSATFLAEKIPNQIQNLINTIIRGFTTVVLAIASKNLLGGFGGSSGALSSALSAMGAGTAGGASLSGLLAGGLLAGGLIWTGLEAGESSRKYGVGAGFKKALTGSTYSYQSLDAQLANTEVDWGEVLSTGAKGGLIGAGVGSFAEGIGAIPGAIIGAVGGVASNLATQITEKAKLKDYINAQQDLNNTTSKLVMAQKSYETALKKSDNALGLLSIVTDETNASEEDRWEAITEIQKLYPTLFTQVKSLSDWGEQENEILKAKVDRELRLAQINYNKASRESASALSGLLGTSGLTGMYNQNLIDAFVNYAEETGQRIDPTSASFKQFAKSQGVAFKTNAEYSSWLDNILASLVSQNFLGRVYSKHGNETWIRLGNLKEEAKNYGSKIESFLSSDAGQTYLNSLEEQFGVLSNWDSDILSLIVAGASESTISDSIDDYMSRITLFNSIVANAPEYGTAYQLHSGNFDIAGLYSAMEAQGYKVQIPSFASGVGFISRDNTLANLHYGETVLNKTNSEILFSTLSKIGLQALQSKVNQAETETVPSKTAVSMEVTLIAINGNLDTLVSLLTEVRDKVVYQSGGTSNIFKSAYSNEVSSFERAY